VTETPESTKTMFKIESRNTFAANLSTARIFAAVSRFMRDDGGATAIEYAMIASGVGVAVAGTVVSVGSGVKGLFTNVATAMK
jgi:pilus assembly protein Flp/PilA